MPAVLNYPQIQFVVLIPYEFFIEWTHAIENVFGPSPEIYGIGPTRLSGIPKSCVAYAEW
jgi:hypothetical protein